MYRAAITGVDRGGHRVRGQRLSTPSRRRTGAGMKRLRPAMTLVEAAGRDCDHRRAGALLLPAVQSCAASARATICKSNLRQIGLAFLQYCDANHGEFLKRGPNAYPGFDKEVLLTHFVAHRGGAIHGKGGRDSDLSGRSCRTPAIEGSFDELRGEQLHRIEYMPPGFHRRPGRDSIYNFNKLQATTRTMILFEAADPPPKKLSNESDDEWFDEHVHVSEWYSPKNVHLGMVTNAVTGDIQPDRHFDIANYLYADGHVDVIAAAQMHDWINALYGFANGIMHDWSNDDEFYLQSCRRCVCCYKRCGRLRSRDSDCCQRRRGHAGGVERSCGSIGIRADDFHGQQH